MCLAVPAKIVDLEGTNATVDLHGNRIQISTMLTPDVHQGDWVLVHAGFAIQHLDEAAARETFNILADVGVIPAVADSPSGAATPPKPAGRGAKKVAKASSAGGGGRHA
jgi:hydrogenase expression/formation protein HypC